MNNESAAESKEIPTESDEGHGAPSQEDKFAGMSRDELCVLILDRSARLEECEDKMKRALADFVNLQKKTESDIRAGVNNQMDRCFLDFLQVYDDLVRARESYTASGISTDGLGSILKNMDAFLSKYSVTAIDALGEIFDPRFHEAISTVPDLELDEGTITKEIRKGYISHNRVIRPTLVEISKKDVV